MADAVVSREYRVGDWLVRPRLGRIQQGEESVRLTPRAMAVLVHLADAGGAVVSRNALLDAVWPNMAVTPDALSQCLVELRKAFRDDPRRPRYIETIPKVGLRLLPPVAVVPETVALAPAVPQAVSGRPTAVSRPARRSRAALLGGLALVAVASIAMLRWPTPTVGSEDGALSVNARARDLMASAEEYARRANRTEALRYEERLYADAVAEDPDFALAWARLGRTHTSIYWYNVDRSARRLELASEALSRALALDPNLPEAHLYLANLHHKGFDDDDAALAELAVAQNSLRGDSELYFLRSSVYRRMGDFERALADGRKAVELDNRNVVFLRQLEVTLLFLRDYAAADAVLDDLLRYYPDDGTAFVDKVVVALCRDGDTALARAYERRRPSAAYANGLAQTHTRWLAAIFDRDYERAIAVLDAAGEGDVFDGDLRPATVPKALYYARTHLLAGRTDAAHALFEAVAAGTQRRIAAAGDDRFITAALHMSLAEARAALGESAAAREAAAAARALVPPSADAVFGSALQLAHVVRVLAPLGDVDAALAELESYLAAPGHWAFAGLNADPRLDALRADARFAALSAIR